MSIRMPLLAALGAATLLLGACHRSEPAPPEAENDAMVAPEPVEPTAPEPAPQVVELPKPEAPPRPKPAPEVSAEQQVQDDADATGMTARADRGGEESGADSQPAGSGGNDQD